MLQQTIAPVLQVPLRGMRSVPRAVEAVTGPRGLGGAARPPAPKALELLGRAIDEVVCTILGLCGEQDPASAAVELWMEPSIAVVTVRFAGPALPDWLLANWDRGEEPAVLAPPTDCGWNWLVVREGIESVSHARVPGGQIVFLEKRL